MKKLLIVLMLVFSQTGFAGEFDREGDVLGLICDFELNQRDAKMEVMITVKGKKAVLDFRNAMNKQPLGRINTTKKMIQPILDEELAEMDDVEFTDKTTDSGIAFQAGAKDFDGNVRLKAQASLKGVDYSLSGCNVKLEHEFKM